MTPEAILEAARPELARWLATNPRVFASRAITITHTDGEPIRVFSGLVDDTIAKLRKACRANGVELARAISDGIRSRTTSEASAVVIVTADLAVHLETFSWARALAETTPS